MTDSANGIIAFQQCGKRNPRIAIWAGNAAIIISAVAITILAVFVATAIIALNHEQVEDAIDFVVENSNVTIRFYKGNAFSVAAPNFVELTVTETEPGFKGDTATGTTKPAVLETGYKIAVPLFVNEGDRIRVDTRTGEYMERC